MKRASPVQRGLGILFAATVFAAGLRLGAAENPPTVAPGIVELPKFVVTDNRELPPPESWRYATIPGFEILTNASDKATQRFIREFEMFRQALSYVWPIESRNPQPASLIISGRGGKFDAFVPKETASPETNKASLFLKKGDRIAIVIDFQATTLNVLNVDDSQDAATGTDSSLISIEHDKVLYREYVRFLMSRMEPRAPAWLEEGLAQIIMKMRFEKRYIEFARLEDPNAVSAQAAMVADINAGFAAAAGADGGGGADGDAGALPGAPAEDRDFSAALHRRALIPLQTFFDVKHDSREARNPLGNNRWAKQAYAFVHMCLYGYPRKQPDGRTEGKYQRAFAKFIERAAREPVTEAMFKECFKLTYKQMLLEIRSYCEFTPYESKVFQSKKGGPDLLIPPPALALRDATQPEIGRIKGEAILLAGNAQAARTALIAPYIRGERDPALLASLGLYEKEHGEEAHARKFLEAAVKEKAVRPDAYLELARYRFNDALAQPEGADGQFSRAQSALIIDLLMTGRQQAPLSLPIYELLGETWMRTAAVPTREEAIALIDGARIHPGRLKLAYQGAVICARAGLIEPAHALADHGVKFAQGGPRARFEALKASLPPRPAPPAKEAAPPAK